MQTQNENIVGCHVWVDEAGNFHSEDIKAKDFYLPTEKVGCAKCANGTGFASENCQYPLCMSEAEQDNIAAEVHAALYTGVGQPPVGFSLYPTMDSLQECVDLAESKLPINNKNDLVGMLGVYHNTLLKVLKA